MANGITIAEQLENIIVSKNAILTALQEKGVTIPEKLKLSEVANLVRALKDADAYAQAWSINRSDMITLDVPEGITEIGNQSFYNCPTLTSLSLPSTLKRIGSIAFYNCQNLPSLHIPEGVTELGGGAFNGCYHLEKLSLPSSLETLASITVFSGCPATCEITFARPKEEVESLDYYPWGIASGAVIHCTNGDLTVS